MYHKSLVMTAAAALGALSIFAGCAGEPSTPPSPAREIEGKTTITTVLADFDGGEPAIRLEPRIDAWGDRIAKTRSDVSFVPNASPEGGGAVRFLFEAGFDEPFGPFLRWKDSGIAFTARFDLGRPPVGAEGVSLRLKPEGFTLLELYLVQGGPRDPWTYYLPLLVTDGAWRSLKPRFSSFLPAEGAPPFDPVKPVALEAHVVYQDNWEAFNFRGRAAAEAVMLADEVGFWRSRAPVEPLLLESFDDERDLLPVSAVLYGSSLWVDYAKSDEGEVKVNEAVRAQRITVERRPGGAAGSALAIVGRLELTPAIAALHDAGQAMALFVKAPLDGLEAAGFSGARAISFSVRSDIVTSGSIEVQDEPNDSFYGASFEFGRDWTRVVIPFDRLETVGGTLADAETLTGLPRLELAFELPPEEVERAAARGVLEFVLQLDEFRLER